MGSDVHFWEDLYSQSDPKTLPWNLGRPDSDLVRLVESGTIPVGQALDIGTGPGNDAVYLIERGFNVIGIDISPSAVTLARQNASNKGLFGYFQTGDIRQIPVEDRYIDFANDRGCFHVLGESDRPKAVRDIHRVLSKKGLFLLRVFSEHEPPRPASSPGPHRFTKTELTGLFQDSFRILQFWEGTFEGPQKPKSYSMLMEKK